MFKVGIYIVSLFFPVFIGFGIFNDQAEDDLIQGFQDLKASYSSELLVQELNVIDQEIQNKKPNVSFPLDHLRALLLLASDKNALAVSDNESIILDREKLAIPANQSWIDWVQGLELSTLDSGTEGSLQYNWCKKLSESLKGEIEPKDLYLTSLFADEHQMP